MYTKRSKNLTITELKNPNSVKGLIMHLNYFDRCRMKREECQGESQVRENFMHGFVCEVRLIHRRSFTLLELIIVISIIGILMTLFLPSLQKARMSTIRSFCLNNEKQLYIAYELYSSSNNDHLPPSRIADGGTSWDDLIATYVGRDMSEPLRRHSAPIKGHFDNEGVNNQILKCPAVDLDSHRKATNPNDPYTTRNYAPIGALSFGAGSPNFGPTSPSYSIKQGQAEDPSGTFLMVDLDRVGSLVGYWGGTSIDIPAHVLGTSKTKGPHKTLHFNYLFIDGHAAQHQYLELGSNHGSRGAYSVRRDD